MAVYLFLLLFGLEHSILNLKNSSPSIRQLYGRVYPNRPSRGPRAQIRLDKAVEFVFGSIKRGEMRGVQQTVVATTIVS